MAPRNRTPLPPQSQFRRGLCRAARQKQASPPRARWPFAAACLAQVSELLPLLPGRGAILDPFVGTGATMLEVMLAGREARGHDLSPLAVGIARYHCWRPSLARGLELRECLGE